jgi:hypothetical protein
MRKKKAVTKSPKRRMRFNPTAFVLGSTIAKNRGVRRKRSDLPEGQSDLAVSFYDMAADYPREGFEMIARRVVPKGFGKNKTSAIFKKEARRDVLSSTVVTAKEDSSRRRVLCIQVLETRGVLSGFLDYQ